MPRFHVLSLPVLALSATLAVGIAGTAQAAPAPSNSAVIAVDVWEHAARDPIARKGVVDGADYLIWTR